MADVNIGAKISVDISGKSIKEVQEDIKKLSQELKTAKIGSDEYKAAAEKLEATQKALANSTKGNSSTFSQLKEQLSNTVPAFNSASSGASSLGKQLLALAANPIVLIIVAIVGALTLLYKAFTSTFEGGQKVEQVFAGIQAAAQVVVDRLIMFGNAVVKFFSGDIKGAMNDAKASVTGIGDEISKTYAKVAQLTKQAQQLHKEQLANDLDSAERQKRLAILREQSMDETVPMAKRKAALQELKRDAEQNAKDDIDLARRTTENKIALLSQGLDGEKKNQDEINRLKIEQINVETENANELRRIGKQLSAVQRQEAAEQKQRDEERKKQLEELKKQEEELYKAYLNRVASRVGLEIVSQKQVEAELDKIRKERARKEKEEKDEILNRQREILAAKTSALYQEAQQREADRQAQLEADRVATEVRISNARVVAEALVSVSQVIGEQTVIGKGLAAASAIINTYQGATKALAQGGIFGFIGAAGVIAAGLASVRRIVSTEIPGQGSGGTTANLSAPTLSAPVQPQAQIQNTVLDQRQINQIGNAAGRSFVLDSDINNNRERITRINRAARIG
jgi:hypothetical protein